MRNYGKIVRDAFKGLQAMPRYVAKPNQISEARAEEMAKVFGWDLGSCMEDFNHANRYGKEVMTRADTTGAGLGQYHNAARLFAAALYEEARISLCELVQERARGNDGLDD